MQQKERWSTVIQTYKIVYGLEDIECSKLFSFDQSAKTRGHSYKIAKKHCKSNTRLNYFSYQLVSTWNFLPEFVVSATPLDNSKANLDNHDDEEHSFRLLELYTLMCRAVSLFLLFVNFSTVSVLCWSWEGLKKTFLSWSPSRIKTMWHTLVDTVIAMFNCQVVFHIFIESFDP